MPKIVSKEEQETIRQALLQQGIALVKDKGLRNVTVDDIVYAVGIAKGTFYSYYKSKEEWLYAVVKNAEKKAFDSMISIPVDDKNYKDAFINVMKEVYLAPDSLTLFIKPEDMEFLLKKLPKEIQEQENEKSQNNFKLGADFLGIDETDHLAYGVLSYLMDSLHFIASNKTNYGEAERQKSLEITVYAIAEFLETRRKNDSI
ncbi:MAG: TetR/AcrR family transcriptional regulator [Lachnospiraceae bacterium]